MEGLIELASIPFNFGSLYYWSFFGIWPKFIGFFSLILQIFMSTTGCIALISREGLKGLAMSVFGWWFFFAPFFYTFYVREVASFVASEGNALQNFKSIYTYFGDHWVAIFVGLAILIAGLLSIANDMHRRSERAREAERDNWGVFSPSEARAYEKAQEVKRIRDHLK